jgi:glycosyltransferase involved in cell wall biosynthesis
MDAERAAWHLQPDRRPVDRRIVYLATYPPRRCGIAVFTGDLRSAVGAGGSVIALGPADGSPSDRTAIEPPEVMAFLDGHLPEDYRRAAVAIDGSGAEVVSLQHEYGIFGGLDGANLLALVHRLRTPLVATMHTVLARPSERQHAILRDLAARSAAVVVMSDMAAGLLARMYDVDPDAIRVIPHGVHDVRRVDPRVPRRQLGLDDHPFVLSFGLIGRGKGYELAIEAMAIVARSIPEARYVILGSTHPDLRTAKARVPGRLCRLAASLGLGDRVRFEDRFRRGPRCPVVAGRRRFVTPSEPRPDRVAFPCDGRGRHHRVHALPVRARCWRETAGARPPGSAPALGEALLALPGPGSAAALARARTPVAGR